MCESVHVRLVALNAPDASSAHNIRAVFMVFNIRRIRSMKKEHSVSFTRTHVHTYRLLRKLTAEPRKLQYIFQRQPRLGCLISSRRHSPCDLATTGMNCAYPDISQQLDHRESDLELHSPSRRRLMIQSSGSLAGLSRFEGQMQLTNIQLQGLCGIY